MTPIVDCPVCKQRDARLDTDRATYVRFWHPYRAFPCALTTATAPYTIPGDDEHKPMLVTAEYIFQEA